MHTGRAYPLDQRLRIYSAQFSYPHWWPRDGYAGFVSTYQSADWSGPITFNGPWELTGWTEGDNTISFEAPPVVVDGFTCECKYHWTFNATRTLIVGELDVYVDGVQQVRTPGTSVPPVSPSSQNYFETFQFAAPANPRRIQRSAVVLNRAGY